MSSYAEELSPEIKRDCSHNNISMVSHPSSGFSRESEGNSHCKLLHITLLSMHNSVNMTLLIDLTKHYKKRPNIVIGMMILLIIFNHFGV